MKEELHDKKIEILSKSFGDLYNHMQKLLLVVKELAVLVEQQRQALVVQDSKFKQLTDIQKGITLDIIAKIQELAVVVDSHHRQLKFNGLRASGKADEQQFGGGTRMGEVLKPS